MPDFSGRGQKMETDVRHLRLIALAAFLTSAATSVAWAITTVVAPSFAAQVMNTAIAATGVLAAIGVMLWIVAWFATKKSGK